MSGEVDTPNSEYSDKTFLKELFWMLKETEDVIDDQENPEKRKLKDKIRKKWSEWKREPKENDVNYLEKLETRKKSILGKIMTLVKKRLGYDLDYTNSVFGDNISNEGKFKDITDLCTQLKLPKQISEYIHLLIFSMISLKYLSDLEYIYRVNRGTIFRDRDFKANKFTYLRFKLHRYIMNFALQSFNPFIVRFNKLRTTMKNTIDTKFYFINMKIEDYITETKRIWKRPSEDPNELDQADQEEMKSNYNECRVYLEENCCVWLEYFHVGIRGNLCPANEFEDEVEEEEKRPNQLSQIPEKVNPVETQMDEMEEEKGPNESSQVRQVTEIVNPVETQMLQDEMEEERQPNESVQISEIVNPVKTQIATTWNNQLPETENTVLLTEDALELDEHDFEGNKIEDAPEPFHQPLFPDFQAAVEVIRAILPNPNQPVPREDAMSLTDSSRSEIAQGEYPASHSHDVAMSISSSDATFPSSDRSDPLNPLKAKANTAMFD